MLQIFSSKNDKYWFWDVDWFFYEEEYCISIKKRKKFVKKETEWKTVAIWDFKIPKTKIYSCGLCKKIGSKQTINENCNFETMPSSIAGVFEKDFKELDIDSQIQYENNFHSRKYCLKCRKFMIKIYEDLTILNKCRITTNKIKANLTKRKQNGN